MAVLKLILRAFVVRSIEMKAFEGFKNGFKQNYEYFEDLFEFQNR